MKYAFIEEQRTQHHVRKLCKLLDVSAAGYYEWRDRPKSARTRENPVLLNKIRTVHGKSRGTYGQPRIHAELRAIGVSAGSKRIARLMKMAACEAFRHAASAAQPIPIIPVLSQIISLHAASIRRRSTFRSAYRPVI